MRNWGLNPDHLRPCLELFLLRGSLLASRMPSFFLPSNPCLYIRIIFLRKSLPSTDFSCNQFCSLSWRTTEHQVPGDTAVRKTDEVPIPAGVKVMQTDNCHRVCDASSTHRHVARLEAQTGFLGGDGILAESWKGGSYLGVDP